MIVHICCSVDSWYFLGKLRSDYPDEEIIGFFYNPNIHPVSEYETRLIDAKRSCQQLNIGFIEGEYETAAWYKATKGLENEPEKGSRCTVCFDTRLHKTAELAQKMGHKSYTTTLLMSPKKDLTQLSSSAAKLKSFFDAEFIIVDYRKGGGTEKQFLLAKEKKAYKQNYCGCQFGLAMQRKTQNRPASELFSTIGKLDDASPDERLGLYKNRIELEAKNQNYHIVKESFLNSRILSGGIIGNNEKVIRSDILPYSAGSFRFKAKPIDLIDLAEGVQYIEKNRLFIVTKEFAKNLSQSDLRLKLCLNSHSLTPLFVVDRRIDDEVTIFLETVEWQDVREILVPIK